MGLPSEALRAARVARGQSPYPLRVILTNSGRLDINLKVFQKSFSPIVIFSTKRMGHDHGPAKLIEGAALALVEFPEISRLFLTGNAPRLEAELKRIACNDRRVEIVHCTQVVEMHESGLEAVRRKKDSSISRAVDLVKKGDAEAVVSAGHTGAAVTASTIKLRTLQGIERPGIAATMPPYVCPAGL